MTGHAKVVHLTSVHPPLDTRVFWKECRTLARAGYEVVLVAPDPPVAEKDGVRFVGHRRAGSRLERVMQTQVKVFRLALRERAAVYHFHDPDLLLVGVLLAVLTRRPVIYDSHEDVPRQLLDRVWIPRRLRPVAAATARLVELACVRFFAAVVSAEPGGIGRFPVHKAVLVQNFPLLEEFPVSPIPYDDRENVVVYVGDITKARGAEVMVRAMGLVPEHLGARLMLAGKCEVPDLLDELGRLDGWKRVEYLGWQSREEVRDLLHRARVGLAVMQPTAQYSEATQPVKLFEYMAAGLPVVVSNFQSWARLFIGGTPGAAVDPRDAGAVAAAIEKMLCNSKEAAAAGRRGLELTAGKINWDSQSDRLVGRYRQLVR